MTADGSNASDDTERSLDGQQLRGCPTAERLGVIGDSRPPSFHGVGGHFGDRCGDTTTETESTISSRMGGQQYGSPRHRNRVPNRRMVSAGGGGHHHHQHHNQCLCGDTTSAVTSDIDTTSFVDSDDDEDDLNSQVSTTTDETSVSKIQERRHRRRRRRHRMPVMSRVSYNRMTQHFSLPLFPIAFPSLSL